MLELAVIGFGSRVGDMVTQLNRFGNVNIAAVADPNAEKVKAQLEGLNCDSARIRFYADADSMLAKESLDGVMIGTRGHLHVELAKKVLALGLPLYLEKPVATTLESLYELHEANQKSKSPVVVSFPLRVTPLVKLAKEIIDSGKLGTIEHIQAFNYVPYGGVYYHYWYRDESYDGGIWLAKTTHDFDYISYLLGQKPVSVLAMESKQVFKGTKPAGLACKDCEDQFTCLESPYTQFLAGETSHPERPAWEPYLCAFATDTGNHDSGSAMVRYESGAHVVYTQNFFARKSAAKRGAILTGYKGTVEFDWYKDELIVHMHHTPHVEQHSIKPAQGDHFGGDIELARNFIGVMQRKETSRAPLEAGIQSALLCMKAAHSAKTQTLQDVSFNTSS
jgi:predicted dehydrogenase